MLNSGSALVTSRNERVSLWDRLGVCLDADVPAVEAAYARHLENGTANPEIRHAWKILRDSFYLDVYRRYGSLTAVEQAGYFDDGLPAAWNEAPARGSWGDLNWLCTPLDKVRERMKHLPPGKKACVLLTTGSFSPLHKGHIQMLALAKEHLEANGWFVAGAYLSPSHDAYVSTKYNGTAALSIDHRLQVCHEAIADSDWLMVDPWEAREAPVSLNFTDVYRRLQAYLARHLANTPLEVFYVYGSDNAGFTMAFQSQGACVCVGRHALDDDKTAALRQMEAERPGFVHYLPSPPQLALYSSTSVRQGAFDQLPAASRELYTTWKAPRSAGPLIHSSTALPYLLRDDLDWATRAWPVPQESLSWFVDELKQLLVQAFAKTSTPDLPIAREVWVLSRARQQHYIDSLMRKGQKVLTLDAGTTASAALRTSRQFRMADGQVFSRTLGASPQSLPLEVQSSGLEAGTYHLVDDDICSGQTLRAIKAALPEAVQIAETTALSEWAFRELVSDERVPYAFHDIVDARDFLLGASSGGLVVPRPDGQLVRAPYLPPYINLVSRAKLPPSALHWLGAKLWTLNTRFFLKWAPNLSVADADVPCQSLLQYLGFSKTARLSDVCQWHETRARRGF